MNILFNVHAYVPVHNAGSEKSFHDIAKALTKRGHEVKVIIPFYGGYEIEGVEVVKEGPHNAELWKWCDMVFTQLNTTGQTINFAKYYKKKVVHFARNDNNYDMVRFRDANHSIVYNSEWVKRSLNYPLNSFVLPPTVDYRYYDVGGYPFNREYITLINHCENKGGLQAIEIAKKMPDKKFLFVDGGYGDQLTEDLPNITVWPNQKDIRKVYKVTRVLLMPSKYESWGRTCTEAMCNGIPVIHTPTQGLMENTCESQIAINRDDIEGWVEEIKNLDDEGIYYLYSNTGSVRSRELDPELYIARFEKWLMEIHKQPYK